MEGNGAFTFIPCPGFCGTIFVNSIASILSTLGSNCDIEVELLNGVYANKVLGGFKHKKVS